MKSCRLEFHTSLPNLSCCAIGKTRCPVLAYMREYRYISPAIADSAANGQKQKQREKIFFGDVSRVRAVSFCATAIRTVKLLAYHAL